MNFSTDLSLALPELILAGGALVLLVWGAFQSRANMVFSLAAVALLVAAGAAAVLGPMGRGFSGGLIADQASAFAKVAIYAASAIAIPLGQPWFQRRGVNNFEFPILIVLAALGMGVAPADIAQEQGVKLSTVRTQIGSIRAKIGVSSITDLVRRVAALPPMVGALRH